MKPEIKLLILNLSRICSLSGSLIKWARLSALPGADASAKLLHLGDGFTAAFSSIAPSFHPADLALGIAGRSLSG